MFFYVFYLQINVFNIYGFSVNTTHAVYKVFQRTNYKIQLERTLNCEKKFRWRKISEKNRFYKVQCDTGLLFFFVLKMSQNV